MRGILLFTYIWLAACMAVAYLKELRHAEARWEKTEKTGQVVSPV